MKPYKVQVIADSSGEWCGNGLTFETVNAAREYANDLMRRWTLVRDWRVIDADGRQVSIMGGPHCGTEENGNV